jgi:hypothetical protein
MSGQPKKRHAMLLSIGDERSPSPAPNCQGRSAFSSSRLYCLNIQIEPNQPFHAKMPRWKQAKITSRPVKNGDNCVHGCRPRPIRRLRSQTTSVRRIEYESPPRPAAFWSAHSRSACPLKERGRGRGDDWPFFDFSIQNPKSKIQDRLAVRKPCASKLWPRTPLIDTRQRRSSNGRCLWQSNFTRSKIPRCMARFERRFQPPNGAEVCLPPVSTGGDLAP